MYLVYFSFVPYLPGDENISLGELEKALIVKPRNFLYPINPNPSGGRILVGYEIEARTDLGFKVFDTQGALVFSKKINKRIPGRHTLSMDLSGLASGLYYVRMESESGAQQQKVVIAR
jgi:hypothetical protein